VTVRANIKAAAASPGHFIQPCGDDALQAAEATRCAALHRFINTPADCNQVVQWLVERFGERDQSTTIGAPPVCRAGVEVVAKKLVRETLKTQELVSDKAVQQGLDRYCGTEAYAARRAEEAKKTAGVCAQRLSDAYIKVLKRSNERAANFCRKASAQQMDEVMAQFRTVKDEVIGTAPCAPELDERPRRVGHKQTEAQRQAYLARIGFETMHVTAAPLIVAAVCSKGIDQGEAAATSVAGSASSLSPCSRALVDAILPRLAKQTSIRRHFCDRPRADMDESTVVGMMSKLFGRTAECAELNAGASSEAGLVAAKAAIFAAHDRLSSVGCGGR